jgi:hypothetical protein
VELLRKTDEIRGANALSHLADEVHSAIDATSRQDVVQRILALHGGWEVSKISCFRMLGVFYPSRRDSMPCEPSSSRRLDVKFVSEMPQQREAHCSG